MRDFVRGITWRKESTFFFFFLSIAFGWRTYCEKKEKIAVRLMWLRCAWPHKKLQFKRLLLMTLKIDFQAAESCLIFHIDIKRHTFCSLRPFALSLK